MVRYKIFLIILLLLSSCQDTFEVRHSKSNPRFVTFHRNHFFSSDKIAPCLKSLRVFDYSSGHTGSILWSIEAKDRCGMLERVEIGVVPKDFKRTSSAEYIGKVIKVEAVSTDGAFGMSSPFVIR